MILRLKIPDAVAKLENLSYEVKEMRRKPDDTMEVVEISDELQAYITEKEIFYKVHSLVIAVKNYYGQVMRKRTFTNSFNEFYGICRPILHIF